MIQKSLALPILLLLLMGCILIALVMGSVPIELSSLLRGTLTEGQEAVLYSIRIPRICLAIIVGAALAVSGAALQGLFRNPIADPGLLGISSGAGLAVASVIVLVGPLSGILGLYGVSIAAFGGGIATCLFIFYLAKITGTLSVTYMLLAGIAMNALAASGTGVLTFISNDQELRTLTIWTMGSLGGALWPTVLVAASLVIPATVILIRNAQQLNILVLGEKEALHLGVNSARLKLTIIVCTALAVGVAVAMSGIIGFVGLVVPHLIRLTIGPNHRLLIPASALLGALLLLVADTLARTLLDHSELPVGILTSLIGGPFFLWLLIKQYSNRFGI